MIKKLSTSVLETLFNLSTTFHVGLIRPSDIELICPKFHLYYNVLSDSLIV